MTPWFAQAKLDGEAQEIKAALMIAKRSRTAAGAKAHRNEILEKPINPRRTSPFDVPLARSAPISITEHRA